MKVGVAGSMAPEAFRLLADAAPLAILIYKRRECVYANACTEQLTGCPASDLLGRPFVDLVHPDDRELVLANEAATTRDARRVAQADLRILRPDGGVRWVDGRSEIIEFEGQRGGVVFLQEITARVQAERALRESEERVRAFFEHSPAGLCILDRELRYRMVNQTLARFNGRPAEAHLGRTVEEVVPAIATSLRARLEQVLRTGEPVLDHELTPDTTAVPGHFHCSYFPVFGSGADVAGVGAVVVNITALRTAEAHERQLEAEMDKLHRLESLGIMAGGIAHDFNNLLVGILGNATLLLDRPALEPGLRECLLDIVEASNRAADLAGQMLAFAGKATYLPRELDLNAVVQGSETQLRASLPRGVTLALELLSPAPRVEGDEAQLRQALWHLVRNAAEAVGTRGGTVTVRTARVDADRALLANTYVDDHLTPGPYVTLEVSDSGPGIDPETLPRIFDPFYSTKFTGRGLGLAAVLGIVRGHEGAVRIDSPPEGGTTVRLLLPEAGARAAPTDTPRGTVLLVDDEPVVVKVASRMLQQEGYDVLIADDGARAVEVFREHGDQIGCVLLDLSMPGMDGRETLQELRKLDPEVPVLLSSGFTAVALAERVTGLEFSGFVQKPYRLETLRAKLSEVLRER